MQVDDYCERLGHGLLAEPANALSNLAFVAAAVALWRLQGSLTARGRQVPGDIRWLPSLVLLGCGWEHSISHLSGTLGGPA